MLLNELAHQCNVLIARKFDWKCKCHILGKLGVQSLFEILHAVPECFRCTCGRRVSRNRPQPLRRIDGNGKFLVQKITLLRIVRRGGFTLEVHLRSMLVSSGKYGATPFSAANNVHVKMGADHNICSRLGSNFRRFRGGRDPAM